jgi:hypothetical protein
MYELEAGYLTVGIEGLSTNSFAVSFKHGLTGRMDIGFSLPYERAESSNEIIGAAAMGVKFQLVPDMVAVTLSNELGSAEYALNGIFTRDIGLVTVHLNAGYAAVGEGPVVQTGTYAVAVERSFSRFNVAAELFSPETGVAEYTVTVRYTLFNELVVDLGYGGGFSGDERSFTVGTHCVF